MDKYFKYINNDANLHMENAKYVTDELLYDLTKKKGKNLEAVVASFTALSGIGFLYSLFSKPKVIAPGDIQLAPPLPNYTIYIFAILFLLGIGYFILKKLKKKKKKSRKR